MIGMKKPRKDSFALLSLIFVLLVLTVLGVGIVFMFISGGRSAVDTTRYDKAFYLANGGGNFAAKKIFGLSNWSGSVGLPMSMRLAEGAFTVTAVNPSATSITLRSTGIVTYEGKSYSRTVSAMLTKESSNWQNTNVLYWGGGGSGSGTSTILNNVNIVGDITANSNIVIGNNVVGDSIYASGTISGSTGGMSGTLESHAPMPSTPPTLDTSYYTNQLAIAATYASGNANWNSQVISGFTYINGNLTVTSNKNITTATAATVVATGTITFNSNVTIGKNITFIAGGLFTMDNNVTLGAADIVYSTTGFSVNNNFLAGTNTPGGGVQILTPGTFSSFWNNATIYGFVYTGGTLNMNNNTSFFGNIVAAQVGSIGNNSSLTLNASLTNFGSIQGLNVGAQSAISSWQEVY